MGRATRAGEPLRRLRTCRSDRFARWSGASHSSPNERLASNPWRPATNARLLERSSPMANLLANNFRFRRTYSKTPHVPVSNLISVQKESYDLFLQTNTPMEERKNVGVQA